MKQIHSKFGAHFTCRMLDLWPEVEDFLADYEACPIPQTISTQNATTLFFLLNARYGGDNYIASTSSERFKYMLFSIIFQYGASWEKRLEIQKSLHQLSLEEITTGSFAVSSRAYNPGTAPTTDETEELPYFNERQTQRQKRGTLEGYAMLVALLDDNITGEFLDRFHSLFSPIGAPQTTLTYTVQNFDNTEDGEPNYLEV